MKYTESRINKAFNELLSEKPYNKITVKSIIERSGVNRGTFYYHYQDIPSLFEEFSRKKADIIINQISDCRQPIDFVFPLMTYYATHKNTILNLYRTMPTQELFEVAQNFHHYYIDKMMDSVLKDHVLGTHERDVLVQYYGYLLTGMAFDWMSHDLSDRFIEDVVLTNKVLKTVEWGF